MISPDRWDTWANQGIPPSFKAIETVIAKARQSGVFVGIAVGDDPDVLIEWVDKGMQFVLMGCDFTLILRAATQVCRQVRAHHEKTLSTMKK